MADNRPMTKRERDALDAENAGKGATRAVIAARVARARAIRGGSQRAADRTDRTGDVNENAPWRRGTRGN